MSTYSASCFKRRWPLSFSPASSYLPTLMPPRLGAAVGGGARAAGAAGGGGSAPRRWRHSGAGWRRPTECAGQRQQGLMPVPTMSAAAASTNVNVERNVNVDVEGGGWDNDYHPAARAAAVGTAVAVTAAGCRLEGRHRAGKLRAGELWWHGPINNAEAPGISPRERSTSWVNPPY
jgi:hypothetical protein